jgi:type IV pilus assembly protein PilM
MLFGKRNQLFGLDIGSSSLKMAEVRRTGKGYVLLTAGVVPLPPEAIVEGAIMNAPAVVEGIMELVGKHKPGTRNVATAVSGHSVIIKKISLPHMSKEELEQSIQWEAEQYIPFNIQDVNLDYQILSDGKQKDAKDGGDQMDVLLVAAKRDLVEDYAGLLREAGLHPVLMDVASFAVENMVEVNHEIDADEVIAVFNIGASITNVNIFRKGGSLFTRDIHFGGNQYTEEIQKAAHVSFQEAESRKILVSDSSRANTVVQEVVSAVTDSLLNELQRSMEFFLASAEGAKIHRVILSGGCSALAGLAEKMQERLGTPVEIADPFQTITADPNRLEPKYLREIAPLMGVSVGLAVRKVGD